MPNSRPPFPSKVEDWKAPWELDDEGNELPEEERQLDPERLKKYLHGLLSDKQRLQTTVNESASKIEELERSISEAPDAAALTALQAQLNEAKQAAEAAKKGPGLQALRFEIALERGLTKAQARRLVGETREELEEDAEELVRDLGLRSQTKEEPGDDDGTRQTPRSSFTNPADPKPGSPTDKMPTPEEFAKQYFASR